MTLRLSTWILAGLLLTGVSRADEMATVADKAPPAEELAPEIAAKLAPQAVTITVKGKAVAEIWLAKSWVVKPDFTPTPSTLYPFKPGELIGAVRYLRSGGDFRDQKISKGVYTLRYGQQPVDGNHVGTSDTQDFLVLLPGEKDKSAKAMSPMEMVMLSTEVSQSTHPAILSMLTAGGEEAKAPELKHYEERELYSLRAAGDAQAGETKQKLTIEFVIVGHSAE